MDHFTGHIPDKEDDKDRTINMETIHAPENANVPSQAVFSLLTDGFTNTTVRSKMKYKTHIYHQGNIGSCTCNAVASAYWYALQRQSQISNDTTDILPSRLFLYYVARISDTEVLAKGNDGRGDYYASLVDTPPKTGAIRAYVGTEIREVIRILARLGAPRESDKFVRPWETGTWPYINTASQLSKDEERYAAPAVNNLYPETALAAMKPDIEAFQQCKQYTDLHYARPLLDVHCWKTCIANGYPIVFAFEVYPTFQASMDKEPFVVDTPDKDSKGEPRDVSGHAVVAVGWNDNVPKSNGQGCFLVQNSWGLGYGDKGMFYIPYSWLTMTSPWKNDSNVKMINSPWVLLDQKAHTKIPNRANL